MTGVQRIAVPPGPALTSAAGDDDLAGLLRRVEVHRRETGDIAGAARSKAAIAQLRASRAGGRPASPDDAAIAEVCFLAEREGVTIEAASRAVAATVPGQSHASTAKRLARKARGKISQA